MHSNINRVIKASIYFWAILGMTLSTFAQTNDGIRSSSGSSSYSSSSSDGFGFVLECCGSIFGEIACGIASELVGGLVMSNIANIESKKLTIPRISSIDLELPIGIIPDNYIIIQPRLKLNGGWFGTDIRTHHGIEQRLASWDTYTTIDWQVLKLNIVNTKKTGFGIGSGLVYEAFSDRGYFEATAFLDIYPLEKWHMSSEARYASDAANQRTMRMEGNVGVAYTLLQNNHFEWHALARFMYARYYGTIDIWSIQFGTSIRIQ